MAQVTRVIVRAVLDQDLTAAAGLARPSSRLRYPIPLFSPRVRAFHAEFRKRRTSGAALVDSTWGSFGRPTSSCVAADSRVSNLRACGQILLVDVRRRLGSLRQGPLFCDCAGVELLGGVDRPSRSSGGLPSEPERLCRGTTSPQKRMLLAVIDERWNGHRAASHSWLRRPSRNASASSASSGARPWRHPRGSSGWLEVRYPETCVRKRCNQEDERT